MDPRLRKLSLILAWPVGIPYLLAVRGRPRAASAVALAFGVAGLVALSAVPWPGDADRSVHVVRKPSVASAYRILGEETSGRERRTVSVRLAEKVTADVLRRIAYEIRDAAPVHYERTFILYYLPDASTDRPAWASTHFRPELEVAIRGTTLEQDQQVATPLR